VVNIQTVVSQKNGWIKMDGRGKITLEGHVFVSVSAVE
jgi:hypothetical protein